MRLNPAVLVCAGEDDATTIIDTPLRTLEISMPFAEIEAIMSDAEAEAQNTSGAGKMQALREFLRSENVIVDEAETYPDAIFDQASFSDEITEHAPDKKVQFVLRGSGELRDEIRDRLFSWGCLVGGDVNENTTAIVGCSAQDHNESFLEINREALDLNKPIFFVSTWRDKITLGPFVLPGQTGCLACMFLREQAALVRPDQHQALRRGSAANGQLLNSKTVTKIAAELAAMQLYLFALGLDSDALFGKVLTIDVLRGESTKLPFMKLPRCDVCAPVRSRYARASWDLGETVP